MNAPLRRVGVVVLVLFSLLFLNLNWVQAYKADAYRNNPHNGRVQLTEYQRQRGSIAVSGGQVVVARSVQTQDELKYQRQYPFGAEYAPILGYKPVNLGATGIEQAENNFLSGNADALFANRVKEMFTGNKTTGGNVLLTLSKNAQDTAFNDVLHNRSGAKSGAAVAIDPRTGAVQAMVSVPTYDPNPLASHDTDAALSAYNQLDGDKTNKPMLNRAIQNTYPPGSTMKVLTAAAALASGQYTPDTVIPAGPSYAPIAGGGFTIHNAESSICPDPTITLINALTQSCNTGFAQLGVKLGANAIKSMAQRFGFEDGGLTLAGNGPNTLTVAPSHTGDMTGSSGQDDPNAVAQSSIGQLNVRETPLQDAMIAATIANNGVQMRPYLVDKLQAPDLTTSSSASPKSLRQPISAQVAGDLQKMMQSVVQNGTGTRAQISGFTVGGKTGTAQNSADDGDHGWFIGFVMKDGQPISAVSVFLEHAGTGGSAEASRIAADIMKSVLRDRGLMK
jgi:peptidoglycan glycosyltransferase